jgi:hypothetical protein|mmetsp:Transcript_30591/g.46939  ORF Transcript_30591/g.46939 Transcript_30591/m.46939 type:complete len:443 (-) Transcript_30591:190-1518(-)|eukprot:CAMPEP_0195281662 /NCGR_PEP_ID=MMETSP0707-20130614/880_1 /TAXON_ID=33640 /ORGANISM="Asterionellopsis glacialis, Strain CCMP134" /LENGTH=442 /DNA_ID=CAMNT_0040340567 /DNA_START=82 /DNA_END=1410 /DNA_ORIENTATION=-
MTTDVTEAIGAMNIKTNGSVDKDQLTNNGEGTEESKLRARLGKSSNKETSPYDWGTPGELTEAEVDCFIKFREQVEGRGGEFRATVYCFGEEEGEIYALCRWLRARKFVYEDVIKMVEEATECRKDARSKGFYPEPVDALGCDSSLFHTQYPQLYTGNAKNGAVLFISKPGVLNVDGMECITNLDGILKYHWHAMIHDFGSRLRAKKAEDPNFKRFECFCILDLEHLTTTQLSSRALSIVKEQSFIDSLCFPETMSKMIIVNAPRFFAASWKLIKGWLDARTANKVEVISSKSVSEAKLLELVDADVLPSDYGGKFTDSKVILDSHIPKGMTRQNSELFYVRSNITHVVDVKANEKMEVIVFTNSTSGGKISITDAAKGTIIVEGVGIKHVGDEAGQKPPTSLNLTPTTQLTGPATYKIKVESNSNRLTASRFFIATNYYPL